jgi:hypothetical protein
LGKLGGLTPITLGKRVWKQIAASVITSTDTPASNLSAKSPTAVYDSTTHSVYLLEDSSADGVLP